MRILLVTNKSKYFFVFVFFLCNFHELVKKNLSVKCTPSLKETNLEEYLELFLNIEF